MGNFKKVYYKGYERLTVQVHQEPDGLFKATIESSTRGEIHRLLFRDFAVAVESITELTEQILKKGK